MPPQHGAGKKPIRPAKRKMQEDEYPAFPGARFPLSDVNRLKSTSAPGAKRSLKMMGTTADSPNRSYLKGFDYGKGGAWKNPNGVQVGRSAQEDSTIYPQKSTGDTANPASLSNAIHIHLHSNPAKGNLQSMAKLANKRKGV